jgi:hypothetical protein
MDHDFLLPNDFEHKRSDSLDWGSFTRMLFRLADVEGFASLWAFYESNTKSFRITRTALAGGLEFLIEAEEDDAYRPANARAKRANGRGRGGGARPPLSLSGMKMPGGRFAPSRRAKGNCT